MEVLTKSGLKSLWDKLKSSFILKKGGGTIVNNGDDSSGWKDYKLGINHTGFGLRDDQDRFRIRLSPDEVELKYKTNSEGTRITDNTISMPGIDLTGNKFSSTNYAGVKVSSYDNTKSTTITEEGIVTKNGTNKEVYTRDGDHVNIGDQPGNLVALDDNGKLPSAVGNFVPLDKASKIIIDADSPMSITSSGIQIDYKKLKFITTMSSVGFETYDYSSDAGHISIQPTGISSYKAKFQILNDVGVVVLDSYQNPIKSTTIKREEILIDNNSTKSQCSMTSYGVSFALNGNTRSNQLVGANKDFYQLNAANGIPQLDANGKLSADVLPSTTITDVQVNGTSVVSDGVANITGLDEKYVSQSNGVITKISSIKLSQENNYDNNSYGIDMHNSDIIGINSLIFNDVADNYNGYEGILIPRTNGKYDSIWSYDGTLYFTKDKEIGSSGTDCEIITSDNLGTYLSSGRIRKDLYISYATSTNLATNPKIIFADNGGQQLGLVYSNWDAYRYSKGLKVMDLDGTDTDNVWFEVQGSIYAGGSINGNQTSDIRLKDNLKEADCISTINSLGDVYTFTYKDTKEDSVGLIAQNVKESSLADLVTENSEGYLGINYWSPKLVCLALGAAQQLDKRVKELEKQIEELKSK